MNILVTLFILGAFFTQNGYGLKCYKCNSGQTSCTTPAQELCSYPNARCSITNATRDIGKVEMRRCAMLMQCNEDTKQQMCQGMNSSGTLKSCEYNCCQEDLCNDGVGPYPPLPTKPPALDLSCYECGPEGMGPNGTGQALISCKTPRERKCGEYYPGYSFDRCMTIKMKVRNPRGGFLEQETKNCSSSSMTCSNNMICQNANSTGDVVGCEVKCCSGNLCNSDQQKSTSSPNTNTSTTNTSTTATPTAATPAGPTAGQTQLAISSIIAIISAVIALLF